MKILNRNWDTGNVEFTINDIPYKFDSSSGINISEHAFNNTGSKVTLKHVFPASYTDNDLFYKPFLLEKYSKAVLKIDGKVIIDGFIKKQTSIEFSPFKNKYIDVTIVTKKEFLTHLPMDFPIIELRYETIVDKILTTLNMSNLYVKGDMSFPNGIVKVYDGKNKTAWDLLQMVADQSDTALVIQDLDDGTSQINFYNRQDILSGNNNNRGVDIIFDTEDNQKLWFNAYEITGFNGKANNVKDVNLVRVESEKVISTRSQILEVDLSRNQDTITTPEPIGVLNRTETVLLNPDKTFNRKLVISSKTQSGNGDLNFITGSQNISINKRLIGKDFIVQVSYRPIVRESFDSEDQADQLDIASRTGTNGKLYRYEKHNDFSTGEDIIATATKYVKAGTESKIILEIVSKKPIWEIGQFSEFIGNDTFDKMGISGGYIVREASIQFTDNGNGILETKTFTYKLVKTIDLQNEWNYYDSLARRDKTFLEDQSDVPDSVRTTTEMVTIKLLDLVKSCTDITEPTLEAELESSLLSSGNEYPIWDI